MKCHYIYDKIAGKVLIPGCMAVAVSGRIEDCTCGHCGLTERQIESKEIQRLKSIIRELTKDNEYLIAELHRHVELLDRLREKSPDAKKSKLPENVQILELKYATNKIKESRGKNYVSQSKENG